MFSPDQLIVYPAQGVGRIERIDKQIIEGEEVPFYIIEILNNNITAMVPVANAKNIGLRQLCTVAEAEEVLQTLQDRSDFSGYAGQNWNRRYREYSERLKSSSLLDVCFVVKELLLISADKDLSFGERRLLEHAMNLIASELSLVLQQAPDAIKEQIEGFYADLLQKNEKEQ